MFVRDKFYCHQLKIQVKLTRPIVRLSRGHRFRFGVTRVDTLIETTRNLLDKCKVVTPSTQLAVIFIVLAIW